MVRFLHSYVIVGGDLDHFVFYYLFSRARKFKAIFVPLQCVRVEAPVNFSFCSDDQSRFLTYL